MAIAEIFLAAFITVLFEKLASVDLIQFARSEGIYSQLNKWNKTLSQIQAVLTDAGEKQIREKRVERWLHDLQDLAYDIDDLLDDLATEAMRRQFNKQSSTSTSTSKVSKIIPTLANFTPRNIMYGRNMSSKLDEITTKLHDLIERKNILGLSDNLERPIRRSRRSEETSLVDESEIVGREGDTKALLKMLLKDEPGNPNFRVVSMVGLGGIGKTTLARVLYNQKEVEDHFELRAWVCVSDVFDVFTISKAIFEAVGGGNQDFANLNLLQVALREKLLKKRFLLVLDDVWNEDYNEWELLQRSFVVGAPGSKILVTTRNLTVTSVMDSVPAFCLSVLSDETALSLFAQHALGEQNFDKHPTLKMHGESIVKKCDGLPLALKALGRVLRTKTKDVDEWEKLLNSEIWNLRSESKILPALKLSYYDLPSHLKQLFAYCCLFPKDYVFDKNELVQFWMAEGFLHESKPNMSMESFGDDYFEELKSRSFFQISTNDKSRYIMHDLINDLATSVAGEFFFKLDDMIGTKPSNKVRHLSYIHHRDGVYSKFEALKSCTRLRTFLAPPVMRGEYHFFYLPNKVLVELLPQLKFLRLLSLSNYAITEVPKSIGHLKHLRYLNFSETYIKCLPEEVCDLYNLQSLLVRGCHKLSSLPNSFVKLINLRYLDINDTPLLNKMPLGIGGLTTLQTLSKVVIEGANGFKISEIKGLLHLRGQLHINGLHNVRSGTEAKEANLQQKKKVDDLKMEWKYDFDDSRNKRSEYEVLEGLRPHDDLRKLEILLYGGMEFPSWVGDSSFDQLTELTLRGCRSCTYLPTLGHLQSLRKLFVASMNEVKDLGSELLGPTRIAFPSLEVLEFRDMQGWEIWLSTTTGGGDNVGTFTWFPCLREISIVNCPKLAQVSIALIPSLSVLHIEECCEVVLRSMVGVSWSIVRLRVENIKGLTQLHGDVLGHLKAVENLCIGYCEELRYLWESEPDLVRLQKLSVWDCKNLVSSAEKGVNMGISMKSVSKVTFHNCGSLKSYNCPNSIERLNVWRCPSMTSLTFPSTLKFLHIDECRNLEENWLLNPLLESLEIYRCHNLRSFPEDCFVHLTKFTIWDCDNIESIPDEGFGFLPLRNLHIGYCKNLKSFPHEHLQSLTSLEELTIKHCPRIDYSFPCRMWPPNLKNLEIGCLNKPMSKWGQQNYPPSLVSLNLHGESSGVVSFAEAGDVRNANSSSRSFLLPPSLTSLSINGFMDLESVSKGLQHLIGLESLVITSCPNLRDLPKTLPPSLSCLWVRHCRKLETRCSEKGKYWPIISQIHHVATWPGDDNDP